MNMRTFAAAAAILVGTALSPAIVPVVGVSPAFADNNGHNSDPLPGCGPSNQTPQKCDVNNGGDGGNGGTGGNGGAGGSGGSGGTGIGVGVGVGVGGDVNNSGNNVGTGGSATGGSATATGGSATGGAGGIGVGGSVGDVSSKSASDANAVSGSNSTSVARGGNATIEDGAVRNHNTNTNALNNTNENNSAAVVAGSGNSSNTNDNSANNSSNNSSSNAASSSGNTTNVTSVTNYKRAYRNVATAYAPTVVGAGGSDSCLGSMSGGGQTGLFGISLGGTTKDEACRTIKLSRRAEELGMPDVACQILALDPKFNEGLRRAGRGCGMEQFAGRMVPVTTAVPTTPVGDAVIPQATPVQVPSYPAAGERGK